MKRFLLLVFLLNSFIVFAQSNLNLVPMPAEVNVRKGDLVITPYTTISYNHSEAFIEDAKKIALYLQSEIKKNTNLNLTVIENKNRRIIQNDISINIVSLKAQPAKNYQLGITKKGCGIIANNPEDIFYGIQTLLQIIEQSSKKKIGNSFQLSVPQLSITDYPRFQYRGMHLDVARHFEPISYIKKYIDYLAAYKFNTFHWHLTDDQGWRIEIKKYPNLTKVGGYRNGTIIGRYPGKGNDNERHGGFYTQDEIKEIVKYAADRYITVIPEIEMPGHASAAIAAYPQLSCFPNEDTKVPKDCAWSGATKGKQVQQTWGVFEDVFAPTDYTFNFLQDVLNEVMALFPSKYIHIGGDECPKEAWKRSEFCQQLIKEKGLKDEHELQSYFINRIEKYVNSKGRNIIGWDEILEGGLALNATVMSWRGEDGGIEAAKLNHDVIMTPGGWCYFDHSQSKNEDSVTIGGYTPLEKVYSYEPAPASLTTEQGKHILGAQANLWTEYIKNPSKIEYMLFPRMMALSEVLWTPKEKRNWNDFEKRLPNLLENLDKKKINYSKAYYDLKATVLPTENNEGILWKLEQKSKEGITLNINRGDTIWGYTKPQLITSSCTYYAYNKNANISQKFYFNKATGKKISLTTEASKSYPGDGAFTLVNGIQNEKGLNRGSEFMGFSGTNCEGKIDFGTTAIVTSVRFHVYVQKGSWIYLPSNTTISYGNDIIGYTKKSESVVSEINNANYVIEIKLDKPTALSVLNFTIQNYGIIPSGNPGAGNKAWLFVDEIEVL